MSQQPPAPFPVPLGQPPPPPQGPYGYVAPQGSGKAIGSLVIGIVSLVIGWACCVLGLIPAATAIVLGRMARNDIKQSGGLLTGGGMATGGEILGYVSVVVIIVISVLWVGLFVLGNSTKDVLCNISNGLAGSP